MAGKSDQALKFQLQELADRGRLYLWTFTFPILVDVDKAVKAWSALSKRLVKEMGFTGVRVFEMHAEHGLHIHVVACGFYRVRFVRTISRACGFGRIHVTRIKRNPLYVTKYVSKADRPKCLLGRRVWSVMGMGKKTWAHKARVRVRDVQLDTRLSRSVKLARAMMPEADGLTQFKLGFKIEQHCIIEGNELRDGYSTFWQAWAAEWADLRHGCGPTQEDRAAPWYDVNPARAARSASLTLSNREHFSRGHKRTVLCGSGAIEWKGVNYETEISRGVSDRLYAAFA